MLCLVLGGTAAADTAERAAGAAGAAPELATAETRLLAGDYEGAATAYAAVLERSPLAERAMLGRVEALLELGRWREALDEAARAQRRSPRRPGLVAALGEALYRGGRLESLDALLTERAADPNAWGRSLSLLGLLRSAQGRGEEAVEWMTRALEAAPSDRRVWIRAAEATATRAEAARRLERYLELAAGDDPDRIRGAEGTLEVLRELGERPVWVARSRPEVVELPLALLRDGRGTLRGAVLRARLGPRHKQVRLLLDTGSTGLFLTSRASRKSRARPLAEETTFGGGGGGRHASRRVLLDRVALGQLEFEQGLATTARTILDPERRYEGVLGVSIFDGYRVSIDLDRGVLRLDRREAAGRPGEPYWTVSGQMLVRAGVDGGPDGLFLVDTGASVSVVDEGFAGRVEGARLRGAAPLRGFGGEVEGARVAEGIELVFQGRGTGAGRSLRAADLALRGKLGGVDVCGYLGLDLMAGTTLAIDTRGRTLRLGGDGAR